MTIQHNFDLSNYNSYKLHATCKVAYFPDDENEILELYKKKNKYILLGNGNNVILASREYDECIIFNGNFNSVSVLDGGIIEAEAGTTMTEISEIACQNALSGLEVFCDIPSSLGGAVVMNAGASGEEIKDVLTKVRFLDLVDMRIKEIQKDAISFEYRNSFFQRNTDKIVLKAWMRLKAGNRIDISEKMNLIKTQRWAKQPKEFPNAGSVFKRPNGYFVGAIMDELNLKGYSVGGAKISEKHGGFIINYDGATGTDIIELIKYVKQKAWDRFGVDLEVEQRII